MSGRYIVYSRCTLLSSRFVHHTFIQGHTYDDIIIYTGGQAKVSKYWRKVLCVDFHMIHPPVVTEDHLENVVIPRVEGRSDRKRSTLLILDGFTLQLYPRRRVIPRLFMNAGHWGITLVVQLSQVCQLPCNIRNNTGVVIVLDCDTFLSDRFLTQRFKNYWLFDAGPNPQDQGITYWTNYFSSYDPSSPKKRPMLTVRFHSFAALTEITGLPKFSSRHSVKISDNPKRRHKQTILTWISFVYSYFCNRISMVQAPDHIVSRCLSRLSWPIWLSILQRVYAKELLHSADCWLYHSGTS